MLLPRGDKPPADAALERRSNKKRSPEALFSGVQRGYSTLAPETFTAFAHFSVSMA
jgi:hypothetical protein